MRVTELPTRKQYSGGDFVIRLQSLPVDLRPHEYGLLEWSADQQSLRRRLSVFGAALFVLGMVGAVVCFALLSRLGGWPLLVPLSLLGTAGAGGVIFIAAVAISPLSDEGIRLK